MKTIQLDLPILKDCKAKDFGSETHCGKLTENELPFAYDFNEQYAIGLTEWEINVNTFCFTAYEKDGYKIVGLLGVSNEPIEPRDDSEYLFHKIEYIVADKRLFTNDFLVHAFRILFCSMVDIENGKKEVFWFDCQGIHVSQVIDCEVLKKAFKEGHAYFYLNQAEYFATYILGDNRRKVDYSKYEHSFSHKLLKDFEEGRFDEFDTETIRGLIYGYTFTEDYANGLIPDTLSMGYWQWEDNNKVYLGQDRLIEQALMSSGDGTENNPFCVICMDQEYDIINSLSPAMKVLRQRLLPGYIDCFECEENGVPRVVYFDISRWFERVKLF